MSLHRGLASALVAGALALPSASQVLTWDGAVISEQVDFTLQGDPGELYLLGVSAFPGPTPLSVISPGDPRQLNIALTSLGLWRSSVLDPTGAAIENYPLPLNPAQVGTPIYSQFVTLPGATFLVDDVSNPASFRLALHGSEVNTVGTRVPTDTHSATLLGDGSVLLAGGILRTTLGDAAVDTLIIKCRRAMEQTGYTQLVMAGGVSANRSLRAKLGEQMKKRGVELFYPAPQYCTDNGAMIAFAGALRLQAGESAELPIKVRARWPLTELAAL